MHFLWQTFTTRYHLCLKLANCGAYFNGLSFFPNGFWTCISENRLQLSNSLRTGIGICTWEVHYPRLSTCIKKVITSHNDCRDDRENLITMKTSYPVHCCFIGRYVFCKDVHAYFFQVIRVHIYTTLKTKKIVEYIHLPKSYVSVHDQSAKFNKICV